MKFPEGVVLFDSLGDLKPDNTNPILVCGSHCGGNRELAIYVNNCNIRAVFLNCAGIGKNDAGIRGLQHYQAEQIIACAVDQNSAEIGIAQDTWNSGIISHLNPLAKASGIQIGDSVQEAVLKLGEIDSSSSDTKVTSRENKKDNKTKEEKSELKQQTQVSINGTEITVADSITFLNESNKGDIVVCGSHGGQSAGHYAQKHKVKAVFFNDAGIGKNNAGTKSLKSLNNLGILAGTVDCMTAEIFNGIDVLNNGVISVCNQLAIDKGIKVGMRVLEAIPLI